MSEKNYQRVYIGRDVLAEDRIEAATQRDLWTRQGTLVVNLVSSPGAGKTSLLEATAKHWQGRHSTAVLVGDLETDRDAQRLSPWTKVAQLTTGGACHLQMPLVRSGLRALGNPRVDFLFIENVGNLVCPASHDLGEHLRVVVLSVTEGDDKPAKYPKMFRTSQVMVISKADLLPHVPFEVDAAIADARRTQPEIACLTLCASNGAGITPWCQYLEQTRQRMLENLPCETT